MTNQEFIDQVAVYVKKYAAIFGICVHSPIIAQAILESGWGKSKLAATYHNYFGLKCGTKWTGKSVNMNTRLLKTKVKDILVRSGMGEITEE